MMRRTLALLYVSASLSLGLLLAVYVAINGASR